MSFEFWGSYLLIGFFLLLNIFKFISDINTLIQILNQIIGLSLIGCPHKFVDYDYVTLANKVHNFD